MADSEVLGTFSLTVYNIPAPIAKNMAADYQRAIDPSFWVDTSWMPDSDEQAGSFSESRESVEHAPTFRQELEALISKHSVEPDWILMEYLMKTLEAWEQRHAREEYYGR